MRGLIFIVPPVMSHEPCIKTGGFIYDTPVWFCPSSGTHMHYVYIPIAGFRYQFRTMLCRVMLVGWGGNNGSTVTAGCLANKQ